ncbi:MAG: hypothetical protein ACI4JA_01050 [Oscillospiraceae bacterium]
MKMEYTKPEIEVSAFDTEDVITLSEGTFSANNYNDVFGGDNE